MGSRSSRRCSRLISLNVRDRCVRRGSIQTKACSSRSPHYIALDARREPPALPTCSLESTCLHSMRTVSSSSLGPRCKPATCSWERSTCSHRMRSCRKARSARCHLAAAAALGRGLVAAAILQQIMHTFSSRPQRTGLHVVLHLPRKWIRVAQGDERASQLSTVAARPIANFVARANCLRLLSK